MLGKFGITEVIGAAVHNRGKVQYEAKEGYPTLGLDTITDKNIWI